MVEILEPSKIHTKEIKIVPLCQITRENRTFSFRLDNPRRLIELKHDFKKVGQLFPISIEETKENHYRILDGFQRFKVAKSSLRCFVYPKSTLTDLDRFQIIKGNNFFGSKPFGLMEKCEFLKFFLKRGLSLEVLAAHTHLSPHDIEDLFELDEAPPKFFPSLNKTPIAPIYAAMLFRRYKYWIDTPHKKEADRLFWKLLTVPKRESLTMKAWRFYLDFYWPEQGPTKVNPS